MKVLSKIIYGCATIYFSILMIMTIFGEPTLEKMTTMIACLGIAVFLREDVKNDSGQS